MILMGGGRRLWRGSGIGFDDAAGLDYVVAL